VELAQPNMTTCLSVCLGGFTRPILATHRDTLVTRTLPVAPHSSHIQPTQVVDCLRNALLTTTGQRDTSQQVPGVQDERPLGHNPPDDTSPEMSSALSVRSTQLK